MHGDERKGGYRVGIGCKLVSTLSIRASEKGLAGAAARDGLSHRQETHYIWQRFHSARLSLFSPGRFSWHRATLSVSSLVSRSPAPNFCILFVCIYPFGLLPPFCRLQSTLCARYCFSGAADFAGANHRYLLEAIRYVKYLQGGCERKYHPGVLNFSLKQTRRESSDDKVDFERAEVVVSA